MKKLLSIISSLTVVACTIPVYDAARFEEQANVRIEKVYNTQYDKLNSCLVSKTNVPVTNSVTADGAYYNYPGFLKIDFIPLGKNKTRVLARSIGSFAKADEFVAYIEKTCLPQ